MTPREILERIAGYAPPKDEPRPATHPAGAAFDLERFIASHLSYSVVQQGSWQSGRKWVLSPCPFDANHADRSAVLIEMGSGAIVFRCHHNGCIGHDWRELRALFEPPELRHTEPTRASARIVSSNGRESPGPMETPVPALPVDSEIPEFPMTDTGNAERFRFWNGEDVLFCAPWNKFLVWDGTRHLIDTNGEVGRRAVETVRRIRSVEILRESDADKRKELAKHGLRSEGDGRIKALLNRLKDMAPAGPEDFDQDPMALNCANGVLDLGTGVLRSHSQRDRLTKCTNVPYDAQARCDLWEQFLWRVTGENQRLISFLQRAVGYLLTGLTSEEILLFLYGIGRNGKSVFIGAIQFLMGEYARSTRPETLMAKQGHDIPNDIAALVGARFVATVEIDEGARLAESLVKQLTGGDRVTARFLYGENFDFKPNFKIVMAGNHKPVIRGTDLAIWERILTVPFTVTIPAEERDKQLKQKLEREAPGILAWAVRGCQEWQRIGLDPPPEVQAATDEYRSEMDVLAQFLEDCCDLEYTATAKAGELYERYTEWCKASGERQWSQQLFGRRLAERGLEKSKFAGIRAWQGIRLRSRE